MNKKLLLTMFVFFVFSSFVSAEVMFSEDFEDGNTVGWTSYLIGGTFSAQNSVIINGSYTGKLDDSSTSKSQLIKYDFGSGSELYNWSEYCFSFRGISTSDANFFAITYTDIVSFTEFNGDDIFKITFDNFGNVLYTDGGVSTDSGINWVANTNYRLCINDTDFTGYTADIWLDSTRLVNDASFKHNYDYIRNIGVSGVGSSLTGITYMDDFIVNNESIVVGANNFSITAISDYNDDAILNFSVDIGGSIYNTTNGTIVTDILDNSTDLFNITFFNGNWYNRTYENVNVNSSLIGELNQTDIDFNFYFSSGDLVTTPINVTDLNNSIFFNVSGGQLNFSPIADTITFSVRCNNSVFAPFNITIPFSALQNESFDFTVNETPTILTFLDVNTSSPIVNGTVVVNYPSGASENYTTNSSGSISFSYIYNDTLEFGDYVFSFSKVGYLPLNISETINSSNVPFSATYNVSRAILTVNVYDRVTRTLLTGINVTVAFIGLFNETTLTGTVEKDNLTIIGGDYLIYASADGYKTSVRSLTFTNQEEFTLNFYLLNLSADNYGNVLVTTQDSYFREITGSSCDLLEYVPSELSFSSVESCVTNINAECVFNVELNEKVYYIRCSSVIGDELFVAETNPNGEIYAINNDVKNLIFYNRDDFIVSSVDNLYYDISPSFSEVTNISSISVDFNSLDGTAITMCVEYYKLVDGVYISVTGDLYCLDSSSAIQNIGVSVTLDRSNTYKAVVYVKNGGNKPLDTFYFPSVTDTDSVFSDSVKGALLLFLYIGALGVAFHLENVLLFFIASIVFSWISFLIFPLFVVIEASVYKTIIAIITMYIARKRKDFV